MDDDAPPFPVESVRPDIGLFRSDAAPGQVSFIITHHGVRVLRIEVAERLYSAELAARVLRFIQAKIPPDLTELP